MKTAHRIRCSEIWGGNRGEELSVETSGVRACLYSRACDGDEGKGGDIYYFSVCGDDLLTRIAIVDVAGHGEAVSNTSSWLYDSLAERMNSADGSQVLADLNRASVDRGYEAISTATIAAFYRSSSRFFVSYAGHHELLYLRQGDKSWHSLPIQSGPDIADLPLGVDEGCKFTQKDEPASLGDRLFMYTDGLIEAFNKDGEQFGVARLTAVLNRVSDQELPAIRSAVIDSVRAHTGGRLDHDDVTFMVIEFAEMAEQI